MRLLKRCVAWAALGASVAAPWGCRCVSPDANVGYACSTDADCPAARPWCVAGHCAAAPAQDGGADASVPDAAVAPFGGLSLGAASGMSDGGRFHADGVLELPLAGQGSAESDGGRFHMTGGFIQ